jgi:hypothetical protein
VAIKTFGKLQKGNPSSFEFGFYGFRKGLNVKAAPQLIEDDELSIATNGYLRPDGAFQMRNGMNPYTTATTSYSICLARFFQLVRNGTNVGVVKSLLGVDNGLLVSIPTSGAATAIGSVGGSSVIQATFQRFEDPNDPNFASGLTDVIAICTGVGGPYIYDGTNLYTPSGWSNAAGASWVAIVNGILWFGGIPAFPNQIFGSGDGIIASMESLPAYRNFVFSSPVVGLCAQGTGATATLVVALNTGISVLYGTGPSTFFLQDVPWSDGVVSGRAMTSYGGVVYMLGHMAEYYFDAQTIPKPISKNVEPWILNDPFTPGYPMTGNQNLSWSAVYNNRLHIGYCSNSSAPNTILCFDLDLGAWTVLTPTPGIASMILLDAPNDPDPYVCIVGPSTSGPAYQWDYVAASTSIALDGSTPVLAQVQSKFFKLGVPGTNKALQRFYPEFLVAGVFSQPFTVSSNYGSSTTQVETTVPNPPTNALVWDVGFWDVNFWAGPNQMIPFGSPQSRLDFPSLQGESFAFGVNMNSSSAPWIWVGGTGVFCQQGRT